ncbi:MAG: ferredoxin [Armatimonadota bacterium]
MDDNTPHPLNVPGPFYVEDGCCVACMVPHLIAPDLMGFDEESSHCFVRQQPSSPEAVTRAIFAVRISEVGCLRYGGTDPDILRRFAELGEAGACDHAPPPGAGFVLRNHVSFEAPPGMDLESLAERLRGRLAANLKRYSGFQLTPVTQEGPELRFSVAWFQGQFRPYWIGPGELGTHRTLIRHSPAAMPGSVSMTLELDEWLKSEPAFREIRWYTADQWKRQSDDWQPLPY